MYLMTSQLYNVTAWLYISCDIIIAVTYEEFDIEVIKGSGPLGLKVVGGADTNMKDVLIKEIVPNTQADIDGQLRPGDHILKVPILCYSYRIRQQNFRVRKLSRLCAKYTIHWKTFAVHQAVTIMYCTQQVIQGENFHDRLKNRESFAVYGICGICGLLQL